LGLQRTRRDYPTCVRLAAMPCRRRRPMKLPPFEHDLSLASTLPAKLYVDPAVHVLERERIFARTWQPAGNLADVASPGAFFTVEVAGEPLLVARGLDGELRAFYN